MRLTSTALQGKHEQQDAFCFARPLVEQMNEPIHVSVRQSIIQQNKRTNYKKFTSKRSLNEQFCPSDVMLMRSKSVGNRDHDVPYVTHSRKTYGVLRSNRWIDYVHSRKIFQKNIWKFLEFSFINSPDLTKSRQLVRLDPDPDTTTLSYSELHQILQKHRSGGF